MARILVTGSSGFLGSALVAALAREGLAVRAAYRILPTHVVADDNIAVGDLGPATDWRRALDDITQVVHFAGPAHRHTSNETYRREIVDATDALAAQADAAGVRRFVFMSSVKAAADKGGPLSERDTPTPGSPYGRAKLEAERHVLARTTLLPVALRPPLVHAANARGNFGALLRLAGTALPLPLGGITNKRSIIALDSLVAAIIAVLRSPEGPPGAFFVTDKPACSTSEIVAALRQGMGKRGRLFAAPALTHLLPSVLTEGLEVDDSAFRAAYTRAPIFDAREALRRTGAACKARS